MNGVNCACSPFFFLPGMTKINYLIAKMFKSWALSPWRGDSRVLGRTKADFREQGVLGSIACRNCSHVPLLFFFFFTSKATVKMFAKYRVIDRY